MLRMVDRKFLMGLCFYLGTGLYAGVQTIDVGLNLSHTGASQQIINDKMVIDLGFLKQGISYTGANQIKIGTVTVRITQSKSSTDASGCILEDMEFNSVNIRKLGTYSEKIATVDKLYVGGNNGIILTAKDIKAVVTQGDISAAEEEYFFVSPECVTEGVMAGVALTSLQYEFDLFADINGVIPTGTVAGAFGQDDKGIAVSVKDLITSQIRNSNLKPYRRRK